MIILAVDPGGKRTGLAVCDPDEKMALALETYEMTGEPSEDARHVAETAKQHGAGLIVVGLPINMDGTEGPRAREVRAFIDDLKYSTELPIEPWDERLSTAEGERRLREVGLDRRGVSKRSDSAAAIVILERVLEYRKKQPE